MVRRFRLRKRWQRWLLEGVLVVLVILAVRAWQQHGLATAQAPPLAGIGVTGEPLELARLRGRPVLLHFWATWCSICRLEEESIDAIARDHAVLTVAMQSGEAETLASYLQEAGLRFPVLPDPDGRLAARYGVRTVPATFILDPEGRIRFREVGYTTGWGLRLRLWWAGRG